MSEIRINSEVIAEDRNFDEFKKTDGHDEVRDSSLPDDNPFEIKAAPNIYSFTRKNAPTSAFLGLLKNRNIEINCTLSATRKLNPMGGLQEVTQSGGCSIKLNMAASNGENSIEENISEATPKEFPYWDNPDLRESPFETAPYQNKGSNLEGTPVPQAPDKKVAPKFDSPKGTAQKQEDHLTRPSVPEKTAYIINKMKI